MYLYLFHCPRNTGYKWKKMASVFQYCFVSGCPRPNSGLFNCRSLNDSIQILLVCCRKLSFPSQLVLPELHLVCSLSFSPCAPPLPKCGRAGPKEEEGCRGRTIPPAPSGWQVPVHPPLPLWVLTSPGLKVLHPYPLACLWMPER